MEALKGNRQHYHYIDLIRVFSICMVIILHCFSDYYGEAGNAGSTLWMISGFIIELCRTGVPLFFMISGFLLLKEDIPDIGAFYRHRFLKIFFPFLAYDAFYYVTICLRDNRSMSVLDFIRELLHCGSSYHLWFIYSILFLYLLIPFIKIITDKCNLKMLLIFFFIVIFQTTLKPLYNTFFSNYLYIYFTDDFVCGYLGYMLLGYILGKYELSKKAEISIYAAGTISFIVIPCLCAMSVKAGNGYIFHTGYSANHYIEAAALYLLFKRIVKSKNSFISFLSKLTLDAYFIHVFILDRLKLLSPQLTPFKSILLWMIFSVILSFLWGVIKYFITSGIKKLRLTVKASQNNNAGQQ